MILVLSGTTEGNSLIKRLIGDGFDVIASFSSSLGKQSVSGFAPSCSRLILNDKKLVLKDMLDLIDRHGVRCIVDATHPFAVEVSKNALAASAERNIKYIRFERQGVSEKKNGSIIYAEDFGEAENILKKTPGNVLFTIGVNNVRIYRDIYTDKDRRCFIKILPSRESLDRCIDSGVSEKQIVASYKSWGKDLLKSFIRENNIDIILTKQSGRSGGEEEKVRAARESGILLIIIKRPMLSYPIIEYDIEEVIKEIRLPG